MKKTLILSLFIAVFGSFTQAQNNLTLYNMKPIPQKFYANPALKSDAKLFIGVPGASSYYMDFGLSAFKLNDVLNAIDVDENGDTTFKLREFTKGFKKKNFISVSNATDLFSFGVKFKKNYLFVNATVVNNVRFTAPGDFFQFITEGNGGSNIQRTFDFGFGIDALSYGEIGLGYSREIIEDKLIVGGRIHLIKGLGVVNTERSSFEFTTDAQSYDFLLKSDIEINSSNSFASFKGIDPLDTNSVFPDLNATVNDFFTKGNRGQAIDLGVVFQPFKKIQFSASVLNIGKITWNTNTYNWKSEDPTRVYRFNGLNVDDAIDFNKEDVEAAAEQLGDTLRKVFDLNENNNSFTTGLFAQIYLGGNLILSKNHNAGVLLHGSFYKKRLNPAVTFSWNSKLTKVFAVSGTYSVVNRSFANAGLGFSINLGPIQTYFVSDNIIGIFAVNNVNTFNMRAGLNVTIGREKKDD